MDKGVLMVVLFVLVESYVLSLKKSDVGSGNLITNVGKTSDKVSESLKLSLKRSFSDQIVGVNRGFTDGRVCVHKFCNSPSKNAPKTSWRYRSRVRRGAKISHGNSFLIWNRMNRGRNSLEVRRKRLKVNQFRHITSSDKPTTLHKSGIINRVKRSMQNLTEEDDSKVLTEVETVNQDIQNYDEVLQTTILPKLEIVNQTQNYDDIEALSVIQVENKTSNSSLQKEISGNVIETTDLNQHEERVTNISTVHIDVVYNDQDIFQTNASRSSTVNNLTSVHEQIPGPELNSTVKNVFEQPENKSLETVEEGQTIFNKTDSPPLQNLTTSTQTYQNTSTGNIHLLNESNSTKPHQNQSIHPASDTLDITTELSPTNSTEKQPVETVSNSTASSSPSRPRKRRLKQPKINPEMAQWIKGNLHQLPVISVPLRKCPQGHRLHRGRCLQVF